MFAEQDYATEFNKSEWLMVSRSVLNKASTKLDEKKHSVRYLKGLNVKLERECHEKDVQLADIKSENRVLHARLKTRDKDVKWLATINEMVFPLIIHNSRFK
jgi:hypothetical protein